MYFYNECLLCTSLRFKPYSTPANPTPVQPPKPQVQLPPADLREGRRHRIRQGLQFLQ